MDYHLLLDKIKLFPHVAQRVDLYWGTDRCRQYLQDLLLADREGRQGFPFNVVLVVQDLIELHDQQFPKFAPRSSVWTDVGPAKSAPIHRRGQWSR
jgi:hypothetical protein